MKGPIALDEDGLIVRLLEDIVLYLKSKRVNAEGRGQPNANPFVDILGSRDFSDPMQTFIAQIGRE